MGGLLCGEIIITMDEHYNFRQYFVTVDRSEIFLQSSSYKGFNMIKIKAGFYQMTISFKRKNCEVAFLSHRLGVLD